MASLGGRALTALCLAGSISGDAFDISALPHDLFRPLQSVAPSGPWLFPDADVFGDEVRCPLCYAGGLCHVWWEVAGQPYALSPGPRLQNRQIWNVVAYVGSSQHGPPLSSTAMLHMRKPTVKGLRSRLERGEIATGHGLAYRSCPGVCLV